MTTGEPPPSENSRKESTADAIRKARESNITNEALATVRQEIQSLAATMGSVSLSLLELQSAAKFQSERAEETRQESLQQMRALIDSAKNSFAAMASTIERYPQQVDKHLATLSEESGRRACQEKWKVYGGLLAVVTASCLSAWGGWKWHERWAAENPSDYEQLARYMESKYPEVTKKYWKAYVDSLALPPTKK